MKIIKSITEIRDIVKSHRQAGQSIGLVPTMGNLHQGHISLVEKMCRHADIVITSIYVNPLQFGKNEDLDAYPKTFEADQQKLETANCNYIFMPSSTEIYPNGNHSKTLVSVNALDGILCGESRPGHFTGVATIVAKLFNIITPDHAIFGLKDYQQFLVIKQMVIDLCLPIKVMGAQIKQKKNGLALSSRNGYLTAEQLEIAPRLNQILNIIKQNIQDGETNFREIEKQAIMIINDSGFKADYFEIRQQDNLEIATVANHKLAIFIAAHIGTARLIDNIRFELNEKTL